MFKKAIATYEQREYTDVENNLQACRIENGFAHCKKMRNEPRSFANNFVKLFLEDYMFSNDKLKTAEFNNFLTFGKKDTSDNAAQIQK